jgi:hypothetical protein
VEVIIGLSVFGEPWMRKLLGSKGEKVMREWGMLHKDKCRDLYLTPGVETILKIRDE